MVNGQKINENLFTIDLTENLLEKKNINELYSDESRYGGHYSKYGNKIIANIIFKNLQKAKLI